jgi:excinuclease ABC subunit A
MTSESMIRGYKAGRFSFNVKGGRCETCQGSGAYQMNFFRRLRRMRNLSGKRFNRET